LKYISYIVNDYGTCSLKGKFYFGIKRKIDQLCEDTKTLQEEVKGYEEKLNILKEYIKSRLSSDTQNYLTRREISPGVGLGVNGLSTTLTGIELYEKSEDKVNLPWQLTEHTGFWKEWS
jgi:hypothetical protein